MLPTSGRIIHTTANLIALLNEFAATIPGFRERVGNDFARGHQEATGGIIPKVSSYVMFARNVQK